MGRPYLPRTADERARLDAWHRANPPRAAAPVAPRHRHWLRQAMDRPMVDLQHRTITLLCWEGLVGAILGILALPALWFVLAVLVAARP